MGSRDFQGNGQVLVTLTMANMVPFLFSSLVSHRLDTVLGTRM